MHTALAILNSMSPDSPPRIATRITIAVGR